MEQQEIHRSKRSRPCSVSPSVIASIQGKLCSVQRNIQGSLLPAREEKRSIFNMLRQSILQKYSPLYSHNKITKQVFDESGCSMTSTMLPLYDLKEREAHFPFQQLPAALQHIPSVLRRHSDVSSSSPVDIPDIIEVRLLFVPGPNAILAAVRIRNTSK